MANAHVVLLEKMTTADGKRAVSVECERFEAISERFPWLREHGTVSSTSLSQNIDLFEYFDAFDGTCRFMVANWWTQRGHPNLIRLPMLTETTLLLNFFTCSNHSSSSSSTGAGVFQVTFLLGVHFCIFNWFRFCCLCLR